MYGCRLLMTASVGQVHGCVRVGGSCDRPNHHGEAQSFASVRSGDAVETAGASAAMGRRYER